MGMLQEMLHGRIFKGAERSAVRYSVVRVRKLGNEERFGGRRMRRWKNKEGTGEAADF